MFAIPPKFTARVNLKPMMPVEEVARLDPKRILRSIRREIMKNLRARLMQAPFSAKARKALATGLKSKIGPRSVTIYATHPAFFPLLKGQEAGQMRWLLGAKAPIPIVLDSGKVIFRSATAKSMRDGRWVHPGRKATTIVEQARREARSVVKKRIQKEIKRQLRAALRRAL